MFGLMKVPNCMGKEFIDSSKLHYCGVCKSIGSEYSQKSRLLLNNDTVFLSEILSALTKENTFEWNKIYSVKKCMSLPSNNVPLALQFAGTTNVFLSELKFNDNFFDSGKLKYFWLLTKSFFKSDFKKATKRLSNWGINVLDFYKLCDDQNKREKEKISFEINTKGLDYFSEKSSEMTAIVFKTSTKVINKEIESEKMYKIGFHFGKIIYTLDALNDWKSDFKKNKFNAIRASYNHNDKELSESIRNEVINYIKEDYKILSNEINNLELSSKIKDFFIKRLDHNIKRQTELKTCSIKNNSKDNIFSINLSKSNRKPNKNNDDSKNKKQTSFCGFDPYCCECCQCCECIECAEGCGSCGECAEGCGSCGECGSCCECASC